MNKKTLLLTFVLLLSNTVNCFASRDGWDTVLNRLSDSMYGGAYVKEDVLHIKPIDTKQVQDIISDVAPNADIVLDSPAKYTMAQLIDGQNKADKIWDELKLDYVAISEQNNGLSVGSTSEWTEQNKALFIKTTGIENVTFETTQYPEKEENQQQIHRKIVPYSRYAVTLQKDDTISLKQRIHTYIIDYQHNDDTAYGGDEDVAITFEHMPYEKDNYYIMIPFREAVGREISYREFVKNNYSDISEETMKQLIQNEFKQIAQHDYSNYTEKALFTKDNEANSVTISFEGNNFTFYEGNRDFYINGIKRGLYMPPDIIEDEVFLCDKDFAMLFNNSSVIYSKNAEKEFSWYFRSIMSFPLEIEDKLFINVLATAKSEETFRVSTQYDGTIFYRNSYNDKENEKSIAVYEKNGHMMIALQSIPRFRGTPEFLETVWDNQTSTATLKFWGETSKDVSFTNGSNKVFINGVEQQMEEAAEIKDNRLYIPINTLFEILEIPEKNIEWIEPGKNVKVTCGRYTKWENI